MYSLIISKGYITTNDGEYYGVCYNDTMYFTFKTSHV